MPLQASVMRMHAANTIVFCTSSANSEWKCLGRPEVPRGRLMVNRSALVVTRSRVTLALLT